MYKARLASWVTVFFSAQLFCPAVRVNGQVRVAADGQKKVPVPRLLLPGFRGSGTSLGSGLAHAERLSFGNHYDRVMQ